MIKLFRVSVPGSVLVMLLGDILLLVFCYLLPVLWTEELPLAEFLWADNGALQIGLVIVVLIAGLYLSDLYEHFRKQSITAVVQQLCLIQGVELLIQSLLSYVRSPLVSSKWTMLYGSIGALILLPLWRRLFTKLVARRKGGAKILFVGSSPMVQEIVKELHDRPEIGLRAAGYVDRKRDETAESLGLVYLGQPEELPQVTAAQDPERLIVSMRSDTPNSSANFPVEQLLDQQFTGRRIERVSTIYESIFGRVSIKDLQAEDLIFSFEPNHFAEQLQAVYSIVLAAFGFLITLPIMLLVGVAVKVTSTGPVLFRQTRVGKNKRLFVLYKFRSMRVDAEAKTGAVWATKNDPRITPIGGILRKLRLDELPQFINVIRGDMSLVGPRPERPEFVEMLENKIPFFRQRMSVKPGITGWAQINHKYGDTVEDTVTKLEYDLYYIKNMTPSLDAYVIFHTAKVMLLSRGAQ
ncbi:MAG: sugar transferase [Bryobacteraceae bacterium]